MINFGVREVPISTVPDKPGWAYVPDTGVNASHAALQPTSRKRHRTDLAGDTSAKQDAKLLRDLAALDRENHREVAIPVPIRHRDNAGRVSHGKVTPAVRKILQSQKTFANHLADYEALIAAGGQPVLPLTTQPSRGTPTATEAPAKRSHKKKNPHELLKPGRKTSNLPQASTSVKTEAREDTPMTDADAPVLILAAVLDPPEHPQDNNPLLKSKVPVLPSDEEIKKLLAAPPLSYNEAKGGWTDEDMRKPLRHFCEVCGYWGRVKCMRCGGRVCALECLNTHQEECFTRYGA